MDWYHLFDGAVGHLGGGKVRVFPEQVLLHV